MNILIRHTAAAGTVMTGVSPADEDTSAYNIACGHGFRDSTRHGFHIPKTAGEPAKEYVIGACARRLRDHGHTVTVQI